MIFLCYSLSVSQNISVATHVFSTLSCLHFNEAVLKITPIIDKGEVNQVYLVTTQSKKIIFRLNTTSELKRFQKEAWCINAAIDKAVKVPTVFGVGSHEEISYMLFEYIEGLNGDSIRSSEILWLKLGNSLKTIHEINVSGLGEDLSDINSAEDNHNWEEYLDYNIRSLDDNDRLVKEGILDTKKQQSLKQIFERLMSKPFEFGLNHGDFSLANIIVDQSDTPFIIDWGSAQGHIIPHHDLGVILEEILSEDSREFRALLEGYGLTSRDFLEIRDDVYDLRILEAVDKLRWAFDRSPDSIDSQKRLLTRLFP